MFTLWDDAIPWADDRGLPPFQHIAFQGEICPDTGRHHWQGVISFGAYNPKSANEIRTLMGWQNVWLEPRQKSIDAAIRYAHKEDSRGHNPEDQPAEFGEPPAAPQGDQWKAINAMVNDGASVDEIRDAYPEMVFRNYSGICRAVESVARKKHKGGDREVEVIVIIGTTGTGKTRAVHFIEDDLYDKPDGSAVQNWEGYEGEKAVLLDEFTPGSVPLRMLLRATDRWKIGLNVKGGTAYAAFERVWITSNYEIEEWYPGIPNKSFAALMRRFKHVVHLNEHNSYEDFLDWYPHRNDPTYPKPASIMSNKLERQYGRQQTLVAAAVQ